MQTHPTAWQRSLPAWLVVLVSLSLIAATGAAPFPTIIPLPNGFNPEGIASGEGSTFYVGSISTGAIYRGDFKTGEGEVLVPAQAGRAAIGLKYDPRTDLLFVAGGPTCMAYIYDGATGANVADLRLTSAPCFINDVVITQDAAYFTNSFAPEIYTVPLDPKTGALPDPLTFQTLTLSGDFDFIAGSFNTNGIDALPNGDTLIVVNSTTGSLYTVDAETGVATLIDLGGESVPNGDGILLRGKRLYVVQNRLNQVAVIKLSADLSSGEVVERISSPDFRVPTTIATFGSSLYVVNARFGTPVTADTEYEVVRVPN